MAKDPLEHEKALYYENGQRHEIRAHELYNSETYELAKSVPLTSPGGLSLVPVNADGKRLHFRSPAEETTRSVDRGENNPDHDNRIEALLRELNSRMTWKIKTYASYVSGKRIPEKELYDLEAGYQWGSEVHRIVSSDAAVRHDIFGQAEGSLDMSQRLPWIAIEVINTHYPEDKTFSNLLTLTDNIPLLVLFDFTKRPDHFLKIDSDEGVISARLYMRDGQVFNQGERTGIQSSTALTTYAVNSLRKLEQTDRWKAEQSAAKKKS